MSDTVVISRDNRRVAWVAMVGGFLGFGKKFSVVVNGEEGKAYSAIGAGPPIFSPDGSRVAYSAQVGEQWVVVVDGEEGNRYDGFYGQGPTIIFDTDKTFHALAINESEVLLMSARIR